MKLFCNYTREPIGVSVNKIILSFTVNNNDVFDKYEIICSDSVSSLSSEKYKYWYYKSENVDSLSIQYKGKTLNKNSVVMWKVNIYNNQKFVGSEISCFRTGIDFNFSWVQNSEDSDKIEIFKQVFNYQGECVSSILYICGLGFYKASLNGTKIGKEFYTPLFTDYQPRNNKNPYLFEGNKNYCTYNAYDILRYIKKGSNTLKVEVGGGYYSCISKAESEGNNRFGKQKLIFQINIEYADGRREIIGSGENTFVSLSNYKSDLYLGDYVDFRLNEEKYIKASICDEQYPKNLVSNFMLQDIIQKIILPVKTIKQDRKIIYDFGENISGSIFAEVKGKYGDTLTIKFAEIIDDKGNLNYDTSKYYCEQKQIVQKNQYILSGNNDYIEPLFSWKCYRYVEFSFDNDLEVNKIEALFIHGNVDCDGYFESSETILNDIYEKYVRTQKDNIHCGISSDCPHREKLPYTGDFNLVVQSLNYCFDGVALTEKILQDIINAQTKDGYIPNTAPNMGGGGGYAWGNAIADIPFFLYKYTGEKRYLEETFNALLNWISFYEQHEDNLGLVRTNNQKWMLGDWLSPDICQFDVPFMNMLCYFKAIKLALEFAVILKSKIIIILKKKADIIRKRINKYFYNSKTGNYCKGIQGENVVPVAYGIVDKKIKNKIDKKILKIYNDNSFHFDTGIVTTPILLNYLTENGMKDIALKLMLNKTYPSYYSMLENESTFCEHWSKKWPDFYYGEDRVLIKGGNDVSHCHPMFGSVVAWLFRYVAGVNLDEIYKRIIIFSPQYSDSITIIRCEKKTRYGYIYVSGGGGKIQYNISTPRMLMIKCSFDSLAKRIEAIGENAHLSFKNNSGKYEFILSGGNWIIKEVK